MTGIDTNVLIRWLLADPDAPEQSEAVSRHLADLRDDVFVGMVVLAETAWVLRKTFGFPRDRLAAVLKSILEAPGVLIESSAAVSEAIQTFASGGAGFPDCLIGARNAAVGCRTTLTFDRDASKGARFTLID